MRLAIDAWPVAQPPRGAVLLCHVADPAGCERLFQNLPQGSGPYRHDAGQYHEIYNESAERRGAVFHGLRDWLEKFPTANFSQKSPSVAAHRMV